MRNLFFSSLRNSLLTLSLIAVLPALGVILHSSLENRDRALKDAQAEAMRAAQFLASEQQLITVRAEQLLSLLAQMPQVKSLDGPATSSILRRLRRQNSVFANIVAADAQGRVFGSALHLERPATLKPGPQFSAALESGEFTVGDFALGLPGSPPGPLLHFAHPITGADGQTLGLLATALRPDRFERIFGVASLPQGSVLSIADSSGTRLYRYPASQDTSPPGQKIVMELWNEVSGPKHLGTATVNFADGVRRIVAYTQLRLQPDAQPYLYITIGIPEHQALAGAIDTLYRDLSFLAGAALLAVLVAWVVGGVVISRPVERLAAVARRLGGGDLDARSGAPEEFGELALLAKTLDDMAEALSEDITAREAAEVEVRKSEALLRMIMEALPVGVWMSDPGGRILYANQASRRIWGFGQGTPDLSRDLRAWRHDTGEALRAEDFVLAQALNWSVGEAASETEPGPTQVLDIQSPDGTGRAVVHCSAIPLRDEDSNLRAVIVVMEDITERTQREQARDSVEHIMRHDLRSPLVGFSSLPRLLLTQQNLTDEQRGWITRLGAAAGNMLRIIDAYLKLSRIERGGLALEPVKADLVELARQAKENIALLPHLKDRHVLLTLNGEQLAPDARLSLSCEETLCSTMLGNLLKNALEASPEGGVVEVDLAEAGDDAVRVTIRNQGEVPASIRDRFFDKFVTAGKENGTGLGTYSARRIAEFHGGGVSLDCSTPGRTTVTVLLPKTPRTGTVR